MTIGIGLATKECVVLAADSAITHGGAVRQSVSSLGETSDTERGVEEAVLKIVPVGSHAAVAMAGTAHHAVEAVAWFKPHIQAPDLEKAWALAMSVRSELDFELLLARWHNGAPELYRCVGSRAERVRPGRAVIIGSVHDDERSTLATRTRLLLVRGHRPAMIQLGVCALLVWRSLNEVGFKDYVGGTPASLLVDMTGTAWLPDTSAYAVDVRADAAGQLAFHESIHRVSILGREDAIAVSSTYTNQTRILANPLNEERFEAWAARWSEELLKIARENTVKLVALVALIDRRIALLDLELCQRKFILVESDQVKFGEELRKFFLAPAPKKPGGAMFCIPLGEPAALAMIASDGPDDEYDIDLCVNYMFVAADDGNFDDGFRVWESALRRFPQHADLLMAGVIVSEEEPGAPRLERALAAWEAALAVDATLIAHARFVATKHPDQPDVARRLLSAAAKAESVRGGS